MLLLQEGEIPPLFLYLVSHCRIQYLIIQSLISCIQCLVAETRHLFFCVLCLSAESSNPCLLLQSLVSYIYINIGIEINSLYPLSLFLLYSVLCLDAESCIQYLVSCNPCSLPLRPLAPHAALACVVYNILLTYLKHLVLWQMYL